MRHTSVDLSVIPPPDAIDPLDYEQLLADRKAAFLASFDRTRPTPAERTEMATMLDYEYEPIVGLLEQDAYCDLVFTARGNDKVRAVLLATATGTTLDHIGLTYYRTPRRIVTPADPVTGAAAITEDDETYRQRLALSPESWSCAGPVGAYLFYGLSASGDVADIACYSHDEGVCQPAEVQIVILKQGNVAAPAELLATVRTALSRDDIRPAGDLVTVLPALPVPYQLSLTLAIAPGASEALVRAQAMQGIRKYVAGRRRWVGDGEDGPVDLIGRRIRLTSVAAAANVEMVGEVIVDAPAADINAPVAGSLQHLFNAPVCSSITINIVRTGGGWAA